MFKKDHHVGLTQVMNRLPTSVSATLILIILNAAFWLVFAFLVVFGAIPSIPTDGVIKWVMVILALGVSLLARADAPSSVTADEALRTLLAGNERFVRGHLTSVTSREIAQRRPELVHGQKPFAIVLCCSDSRVGRRLCSTKNSATSSSSARPVKSWTRPWPTPKNPVTSLTS